MQSATFIEKTRAAVDRRAMRIERIVVSGGQGLIRWLFLSIHEPSEYEVSFCRSSARDSYNECCKKRDRLSLHKG